MKDYEVDNDQWGNDVARTTFIWTVLLAAGFVAAVVIFILMR